MLRTLSLALLLIPTLAAAADESGVVRGTVSAPGKVRALVVYIEKIAGKRPKAPGKKAVVTQRDARFDPDVLVVREGTAVDFPNEDKVFHNAFSLTPGNDFDLGLYRGGVTKQAVLGQAGEVDVFCNIHPDMAAKVLVLQNDLYVQLEASGAYRLTGIPP